MKFILSILFAIFSLISIPLNLLYIKVQKWYLPMWKKDKVIYFAFAPFYWLLLVITFIFGFPAELLAKSMH